MFNTLDRWRVKSRIVFSPTCPSEMTFLPFNSLFSVSLKTEKASTQSTESFHKTFSFLSTFPSPRKFFDAYCSSPATVVLPYIFLSFFDLEIYFFLEITSREVLHVWTDDLAFPIGIPTEEFFFFSFEKHKWETWEWQFGPLVYNSTGSFVGREAKTVERINSSSAHIHTQKKKNEEKW